MDIFKHLDEHLLNPFLAVEKVSTSIWPSESGVLVEKFGRVVRVGGCDRKVFYRMTGTPKDARGNDFGGSLVMEMGHMIQGWISDKFKTSRIFIDSEVPVLINGESPNGVPYSVSGSIDEVIQDPDTGRPEFVEVKSVGHWKAMDGLCTPDRDGVFLPDESHILQVVPYLDVVRDKFGVKDPVFNIIYVDRDQPKYHAQHVVRLSPGGIPIISNLAGEFPLAHLGLVELHKDWGRIADAVHTKQIPNRPFARQYDNETIEWMYTTNQLTKTDMKMVDSARKAQAPTLLNKGDFACRFCDFARTCYGGNSDRQSAINLPSSGGGVLKTPQDTPDDSVGFMD